MGLFVILITILNIYAFIVLLRVLTSWIPNLDYSNPIVKLLYQATEPVLQPIRNALPPMQGIDISPIVLLIGIQVLTVVLRGF